MKLHFSVPLMVMRRCLWCQSDEPQVLQSKQKRHATSLIVKWQQQQNFISLIGDGSIAVSVVHLLLAALLHHSWCWFFCSKRCLLLIYRVFKSAFALRVSSSDTRSIRGQPMHSIDGWQLLFAECCAIHSQVSDWSLALSFGCFS